MTHNVILIEDDVSHAGQIVAGLERSGFSVRVAHSAEDGIEAIGETKFDLVILDWHLKRASGSDFLKYVRRQLPASYVIVYSGDPSTNRAATESGADDFVRKELNDLETLVCAVQRGLKKRTLKLERAVVDRGKASPADLLVGDSALMREFRQKISEAAQSDLPVLLLGQTGTGKDLAALVIHGLSARRDKPFVGIPCPSIPESLVESELFGHTKGAFTGAEAKQGLVEFADGGTLRLEEIADLPLALQPKLLRFLQDGTFRRVGSVRDSVADVRIVSTTNRDLQERTRKCEFRSDLLYRINAFAIHAPGLEDRLEDIEPLTRHFIAKYDVSRLEEFEAQSAGICDKLRQYAYPGNVRELETVVRVALAVGSGDELAARHFRLPGEPEAAPDQGASIVEHDLRAATRAFQTNYIKQHLRRCNGNVVECSKRIGYSRNQLHRLLVELGIDPDDFRQKGKTVPK